MIGLTSLEVYNSILNIAEEKKFKLHNFPDSRGRTLYEWINNEVEKDLGNSNITHTDIQYEITGPIIFEEYRKKSKEGRWRVYEFASGLY